MAARKRLGREESKALTRSRLLTAAATVFARQGFHAASLEQVAEEAGFTKGAVYSNFASKDELFAALLEQRCRGALDEVRDVLTEARPLEERLAEIGRTLADRFAKDGEWTLLSMEFWGRGVRDPAFRGRLAEIWGQTRDGIAVLIEDAYTSAGRPMKTSPAHLAAAAMAITDGLALQALADPDAISAETVATALGLLFTEARTDATDAHDEEGAAS